MRTISDETIEATISLLYPKLRLRIGKEKDMNKSMGHFTNWKFGVPVRVVKQRSGCSLGESRLIYETSIEFTTINNAGGGMTLSKANHYYELIPYTYSDNVSRYPVCQAPKESAYCGAMDDMKQFFTCETHELTPTPEPTATLKIDGKEIELSAETAARLKKDLGVG